MLNNPNLFYKTQLLWVIILSLIVCSSMSSGIFFENNYRDIISNGKILYVGGNGPGNYSSIQYAINNATDGDKIFVYTGIYKENILLNKELDLIGEDKDNTIIDGCGEWYVVHILANNVTIKNFCITNSTIYGTNSGIKIYGERKNITIENNIIKDNFFGICIGDPYQYKRIYYVNIKNNSIQNNVFGIGFYEGYYTRIKNNKFQNNGIFIIKTSSKDNIVENNTINGLPLLYLEKQSNKTIQQNVGQIILVNCENITVSSQVLNLKCEIGIELLRCTNCNIIKNQISNKYLAIFSFYSKNINIQGNILDNVTYGIRIDNYDDNKITFNKINDSENSIRIYESNHNNISYNILTNGRLGIYLSHSSYNEIFKNYINNFLDNGIKLYYECHRNQIQNNTIKKCLDEGIIIFGTKRIWWDSSCIKNIISGNHVNNNGKGIVLDESAITQVFYNNFIKNDIGVEVRSARYNKIFKNNIFDNKNEDAILKNSFSSIFDRNFWNESKEIHVIKGGIYRWDFWSYEYYEILPLPRFDLHPVKYPYYIGV